MLSRLVPMLDLRVLAAICAARLWFAIFSQFWQKNALDLQYFRTPFKNV